MKIPGDQLFLKYSVRCVWHQQPCHSRSQQYHILSILMFDMNIGDAAGFFFFLLIANVHKCVEVPNQCGPLIVSCDSAIVSCIVVNVETLICFINLAKAG